MKNFVKSIIIIIIIVKTNMNLKNNIILSTLVGVALFFLGKEFSSIYIKIFKSISVKLYDDNYNRLGGLKEKLLFTKKLTDDELEHYNFIKKIKIYHLPINATVCNLKKLKGLKILKISVAEQGIFTGFHNELYEELKHLKNLKTLQIYHNKIISFEKKKIIECLSKCNYLKNLELDIHLNYFPKELTTLQNLKMLRYNSKISTCSYNKLIGITKNTKYIIPLDILRMENLVVLDVATNQEYIIDNNKMYIFYYDEKNAQIPEHIEYLTIMYSESINNLPNSLKILKVSHCDEINNLPCSLEKLYLFKNTLENKEKINNIKIPFCCEVIYV